MPPVARLPRPLRILRMFSAKPEASVRPASSRSTLPRARSPAASPAPLPGRAVPAILIRPAARSAGLRAVVKAAVTPVPGVPVPVLVVVAAVVVVVVAESAALVRPATKVLTIRAASR